MYAESNLGGHLPDNFTQQSLKISLNRDFSHPVFSCFQGMSDEWGMEMNGNEWGDKNI